MTDQSSKIESNDFKQRFGQRLRQFVLKLIHFIDALPHDVTCRIISNQLMRSGASIGANYFEARSASSKNDFINFFTHSLKSANESKFWLETLLDAKKCNELMGKQLLKEVSEISRILAASILTLKSKRKKF